MSLPSSTKPGQASILSFLQPKPSPTSSQPPSSSHAHPPPAHVHLPPQTTTSQLSALARPATPPAEPPLHDPLDAAPPHPAATIRAVTPADIPALRRINSILLPVPYPESFYRNALLPDFSGPFSRVISWNTSFDSSKQETSKNTDSKNEGGSKIVGGIVCKVVPLSWVTSGGLVNDPASPNVLYIQSLAVLAPYRSHGLAASALDASVRTVLGPEHAHRAVAAVCAHVWTENDEGMRWYAARGFVRVGDRPLDYYHRLRPGTAWVMRRSIVPGFGGSPIARPLPTAHPRRDDDNNTSPSKAPPPDTSSNIPPSGTSYQTLRAATEWNDLPADMVVAQTPGGASSATSSRSSSAAPGRKKKERGYPAAAFGK